MERDRLDRLLVTRKLADTRQKAQALVLAGRVRSGHEVLQKPGMRLRADQPLEVLPGPRWVGRGGHKLEGALAALHVDVRGRDVLDIGASTGGFTQVLLAAGARRVVALDVGRGQLDWGLRNDPRVIPLEGVNARHLEPALLPWPPDLVVVDVSFISLERVLPAVRACLVPGGDALTLVKPQFEVGRGNVPRGGIVRDPEQHRLVLERLAHAAVTLGFGVLAVCASSLRGAEGNLEYFLHLRSAAAGLGPAALSQRIAAVLPDAEDLAP